jgi:alcohol dehydrogenase class IV
MRELRLRHSAPAFRTFAGEDALKALPRELDRLDVARAVVFCGASMVRHADVLARVEAAVGARLAGRFDGVREHSPLPDVAAAREFLSDTGAEAVIAVGGGSAVVTARAATILLAEGKDARELCTRRGLDGRLVSPKLDQPKLPQWVVPSTPTTAYAKAGSAVRDPATGERLALFDPKTRAQGIFLDPDVALTAPVPLIQAAALDAFGMAVDGLQSRTDDPLAEALLAEALRMLLHWLPRLHARPGDAEPRLRLMLGALLSGQGSDYVGAGLGQPLSHAIGPSSSVPNGVVEALLLPHTVRYNAPVTSARIARITDAFGKPEEHPSDGSPVDQAVAGLDAFLAALGTPTRLRDIGVVRDALPEIVEHVMDDWFVTQVPRPVGRGEVTALLEAAW